MKAPTYAPIVLLAVLTAPAAAQDASGVWAIEGADGRPALQVRIGPCGYDTSMTCGLIERAADADADAAAAAADLAGRPILTGMAPAGPGRWSGGQIWVPTEDRTYPSSMALSGDILTVEGCVALFCRGQVWRRVQ